MPKAKSQSPIADLYQTQLERLLNFYLGTFSTPKVKRKRKRPD